MERIQKIIAKSGYCSRRKAEELILSGRVKLNNEIAFLGMKADFKDKIYIDDKEISEKEDKVYYLFHKPKNVISSTIDDKGRKSILDYFESDKRLFPIGRLDFDSSGLIIVSNDGELCNELIHPKYKISKHYLVRVKGIINNETINKLMKGVILDGYLTKKCKIKLKEYNFNKKTSTLYVTIYEGRNRQIRRMFDLFNHEVIKLHRIGFGNIDIGNLKAGEYRILKPYELQTLKKLLIKS